MPGRELVTASGVLPLRYVFAAATLPAYQGRGCFSSLLRHAHALAAAEGAAALFLRPAEPGLAAYYERFGYRPYFTAVEEDAAFGGRISPAEDGICPLTGDGQAAACRDAALEKRPVWVRWPAPVVGLSAYGADRFGGAGCYAMGGGEAPGALFFREWMASPKNEPAMLAAAAARYPGRRTFRRRRPAEPGEPAAGRAVRLAMPADGQGRKAAGNRGAGFTVYGAGARLKRAKPAVGRGGVRCARARPAGT